MASLLKRNIKTRLILRDPDKAVSLFGKQDEEKLQVKPLFSFSSFNIATLCYPDYRICSYRGINNIVFVVVERGHKKP